MSKIRLTSDGLSEMHEQQIKDACDLVVAAMNADEGRWAEKTMRFHFGCKQQGLDDGRRYFNYRIDDRVVALVGLHHYGWGPEENVWLAWFAVHPEFQRQGIGSALLAMVEEKAKQLGYARLFVETYNHPDFDKARKFYAAYGFRQAGSISQYLSEAYDMIVYLKTLQ
jgi:GNAT superfamily N-acetyltransferase